MSILSGTIRAKATIEAASTPNIVNLPMAVSGTEYSHSVSAGTKQISIRCRNSATMQMAFVSGDTSIKWITIYPGCNYFLENVILNGITLYLQANQPTVTVEILEWI